MTDSPKRKRRPSKNERDYQKHTRSKRVTSGEEAAMREDDSPLIVDENGRETTCAELSQRYRRELGMGVPSTSLVD